MQILYSQNCPKMRQTFAARAKTSSKQQFSVRRIPFLDSAIFQNLRKKHPLSVSTGNTKKCPPCAIDMNVINHKNIFCIKRVSKSGSRCFDSSCVRSCFIMQKTPRLLSCYNCNQYFPEETVQLKEAFIFAIYFRVTSPLVESELIIC